MKNILILLMLLSSVNYAFSQAISDITTATILSPFVSATKLLETTAVAALGVVQSTKTLVQARGVAGKEQLKDELVALNESIQAGHVRFVSEIQQPGLRELFEEILEDEEHLQDISKLIPEGSLVYRIATVVTVTLMID